jgi:hypothetical protein
MKASPVRIRMASAAIRESDACVFHVGPWLCLDRRVAFLAGDFLVHAGELEARPPVIESVGILPGDEVMASCALA